jgi:nitrate/nitrite transport system ATP-binding protein
VVFQNHSLLTWLSVYKNIEIAVKKVMPDLSKNELKERVEKFIDMVHLTQAKDKYPDEISGGDVNSFLFEFVVEVYYLLNSFLKGG